MKIFYQMPFYALSTFFKFEYLRESVHFSDSSKHNVNLISIKTMYYYFDSINVEIASLIELS